MRARFASAFNAAATVFVRRDPMQSASQAFKDGDYLRALRHGQKALRGDRANQSAQLISARALIRLGRLEEADAILTKIDSETPDNITVINARALIATRREHHEIARNHLQRAYRLDPESFDVARAYISALIRNDEHQTAEQILQKISVRFADHAEVHRLLSIATQHRFDFTAALRHAQRALEIAPASMSVLERYADALSCSGDPEGALATLTKLLANHNDSLRAKRLIARTLVISGERQARDWLVEILDACPGDPDAVIRLARIDETFGRDDEVKQLLAGVDLDRVIPHGQIRALAVLQHNYGNFEAAQRLWNMGLAASPQASDFAIGLSATQLRRGLIDETLDGVEAQAKSSDPRVRHQLVPILHELSIVAGQQQQNGNLASRVLALQSLCFARRPGPETQAILAREHDNLIALRDKVPADLLDGTSGPSVSFICPIHRPQDLENLTAQIARQSLGEFEAVVALHTSDISEADIREQWTERGSLRVIDCSDTPALGGVLNAAIAASTGEILLRIDADDLYFPNFASDMRLALLHHGADVVAKRAIFRYLEGSDTLYLFSPEWSSRRAHIGAGAPGSALGGWRRAFEQTPFDDEMVSGEDFDFVRRSLAHSINVHFVDPFNHLYRRQPKSADHSWRVDDILLPLYDGMPLLVGDKSAMSLVEI